MCTVHDSTPGFFLRKNPAASCGVLHFDVTDLLAEHGIESAVFATAQHLPLTGVLAVALLFLTVTFFLTSANSAALALSMFVSGKEDPGRNLRAFWGIALGAVAAVLARTGSLQVIQTVSIGTAFPLMFLPLLLLYGTFRGLQQYRAGRESSR
jgi:choline/glycine/proline betaine transport protein/glycine betaine transporter